jgi:hypothetical protein
MNYDGVGDLSNGRSFDEMEPKLAVLSLNEANGRRRTDAA